MRAEFISGEVGPSPHSAASPHAQYSSRGGLAALDGGATPGGSAMRHPSSRAAHAGAPGTPGATDKMPTTFDELNRVLQSRHASLSYRIDSVMHVLENNRDNLRGFFSACYQPLLWGIFNFDDGASGWLRSVSAGHDRAAEREAGMLLDLLSPTGPLMKEVLAADADGLMQFAFPLERLPESTQRRLQTDPGSLNQRLPYRNCIQRDAHGRFHVHLGMYHYFFFWSAYYACSQARGGSSSSYDRRPRSSRRSSPYGASGGRQWMAGFLGQNERVHPYRELLLSHLRYFLPRGAEGIGRGAPWAAAENGAGGWARGSELFHRAGGVSQGEMLVSIMIEFWMPGSDDARASPNAMGYPQHVGGHLGFGDGTRRDDGWSRQNGGYARVATASSMYGDAGSMQRQYAYNPPNEDLVNAVVLLTTYLFADAPGESVDEGLQPHSPSSRSTPRRAAPGGDERENAKEDVRRSKEMLQTPLYRFLREAFVQWPVESTASLSPLITLWTTYLTPWSLELPRPARTSRASGSPSSTLSRGIEAVTAAAADARKASSPKFAGDAAPSPASPRNGRRDARWDELHVLHNVPFYCELMRHFLELCCKRVPVDAEGTTNALLIVLRALASCPEVLQMLEEVEEAYNAFVDVDPYAPRPTNVDPPPPSPYDPFLNIIRAQMMDWEPPAPVATYGQEETMRMNAEYHRAHGVPPPKLPKLNMFALDQEGQTQIALALLERLDRDMSTVGPSHPLRSRVPKLRHVAFAVFRLDRLGEEATRRTSIGGASKNDAAAQDNANSSRASSRPAIGWSGVDKTKANAKGLYQGDWLFRPISDMEFPPLARLMIALSVHLRETTGEKTISLRPLAEYGSMLALFVLGFVLWLFLF